MSFTKGDALMLFMGGEALAYAKNHTLTMTGNTIDISTKDHGYWGASEVGNITWEVQTENLFTEDNYDTLYDAMVAKTPVDIVFAKVDNYSENGLKAVGGDVDSWTASTTSGRKGKAVITSLTVNANTGENATCSATFTGSGPLAKISAS